eukprot:981471-Alexandrium_andersonii.AAC.1
MAWKLPFWSFSSAAPDARGLGAGMAFAGISWALVRGAAFRTPSRHSAGATSRVPPPSSLPS